MTGILFICNKKDVFLNEYLTHLDRGKYAIQIVDLAHGEFIDFGSNKIDKILRIPESFPRMVKYSLRYLCALLFMASYAGKKFDVIHILNIKRENFFLVPFFHKRCRKIIITVYGRSTFIYPTKRLLFARVYKYVDLFVFSNRGVISEFQSINPTVPHNKIIEHVPPLSNISFSVKKDKEEIISEFIRNNDIHKEMLRISCSSSASWNDQHDKVIEALKCIKHKTRVQLMFLLTYGGNKESQQQIIDKIKKDLAGFNVRIFTAFLTNSELLAYRAVTDIYINMRWSDQMAGAILESLHEGALLISGGWLNYETLDNLGIYYKKVNHFNELAEAIDASIREFNDFKFNYQKSNARIITEKFALENVLKKWDALYQA